MNVIVCHSHQERCGVREYGLSLDRSFQALGLQVRQHSYADLSFALEGLKRGDVFLVHFEPNLVSPSYLNHYLAIVRERGAKIVFCCHWYEYDYMRQYENHVDRFVVHREYAPRHDAVVPIPLGCPVYEPAKSKAEIREQLEIPRDAIVLTTIGFLTRWKSIPEVTRHMLDAIAQHPDLYLQIHTPWPFEEGDARREEPRIRLLLEDHPQGRRVKFSTEFLQEREALDVVHASDLGFVFHCIHTHSVSAATKQFVSARRPQVVTASTHALDLRGGIHRVGSFDPATFANETVSLAAKPERLAALQREAEDEYERMNMNSVARQYLSLFRSLS